MSAEHVRQSRLAALASRLQRRKDQLERDWRLVQKEHRCTAASLLLEARTAVQKAQSAIEFREELRKRWWVCRTEETGFQWLSEAAEFRRKGGFKARIEFREELIEIETERVDEALR